MDDNLEPCNLIDTILSSPTEHQGFKSLIFIGGTKLKSNIQEEPLLKFIYIFKNIAYVSGFQKSRGAMDRHNHCYNY